TFEDTTIKDVYEVREYEIKTAASLPSGKTALRSEKNIFQIYRDKISTKHINSDSPFLSFESGFSYAPAYYNNVSYTIDKRVHLELVIDGVPSAGFSAKRATLKTEFSPTIGTDVMLPVSIVNTGNNKQ